MLLIHLLFLTLNMEQTLIIIPTFNEAENIEAIITAIFSTNLDINVLVVDDESPDGTGSLVLDLMTTYRQKLFLESRSEKSGLGGAYVHGFKWALKRKYDYIFEMDADFSHNPTELKPMLALLKENFEMVIGSRYVNGINVVNWPLNRILLSYFASMYVQLITAMPLKDPTAGYIGYKRTVLESIALDDIKFVGYAFQIELKYKVWIKKFKLFEHPIVFKNRVLGKSKMSSNIIWEALYGVLFLRLNKQRFK